MIETRLLRYFLAAAQAQSITQAAQALYITQSTLSKQLMDLERQLGRPLFIRGKRRLTLTEEGQYLKTRAQEILTLLERTESAFESGKASLGGQIAIACGETAAMARVTEAFCRFHARHPAVRLHLHSGDAAMVLDRLDKGLADMGILLSPVRQEKYDYWDLKQRDRFGLLMRADDPLAERPAVPLGALTELPLILSEQLFSGQHQLGGLEARLSSLNVVATYNLVYNATFLAQQGLGYVLCLDRLVSGRALAFRPIAPEIPADLVLTVKKYQTHSPAAKAFLQTLCQ